MKPARLIAALVAAAALVLAGCSSTSAGTPEGASSGPGSETSAPGSDGATSDAAEPTADDSSPAGTSDSSSVAPADLDAASAAWFTQFCEVAPSFDTFYTALMSTATAGMDASADSAKLAGLRDALASSVTALGTSMTSVSGKLASMPPPDIANGATLAGSAVDGMAEGGTQLAQLATQIGALPTTDAQTFSTAFNTLLSSLTDMGDSFGVDSAKLDDATKAAIGQLPGCQGSVLFSAGF